MSDIVGKTTVTEKGQITIPIGIRQKEGIKPNDELFIVDADGAIVITRPQKGKLAQIFRQASGMVAYEDIRKLRRENETTLAKKMKK